MVMGVIELTFHYLCYSHSHTVTSGCDYKELISSPQWDSPWSVQQASTLLWKNHTWWELWNIAASGMFPRWPVGSDGGPTGWLAASGVYG